MWRSRSKIGPIAVDIGAGAIKCLQLQGGWEELRVLAAAKFEIPLDLQPGNQRQEMITAALHDLIRKNGFKGNKVLTIVPNTATQFKSFRLPQVPEEELEQVVMFEAEERFAFADAEAEYRFISAGEIRQGQEIRHEIIAMGCPGPVLREHLSLFETLGLTCIGIETAPCALIRAFERPSAPPPAPDEAHLYADVGCSATRITITRGGKIIFIKSIDVGGGRFNEAVAHKLSLPITEAHALRRQIIALQRQDGDTAQAAAIQAELIDAAQQACAAGIEQLGKEIALCIRYYLVTFRGVRPEVLLCAGGESHDPKVLSGLGEITGVATTAASPLRGIVAEGVFSGADRRSGLLEWATVTGLALRGMPVRTLQEAAS